MMEANDGAGVGVVDTGDVETARVIQRESVSAVLELRRGLAFASRRGPVGPHTLVAMAALAKTLQNIAKELDTRVRDEVRDPAYGHKLLNGSDGSSVQVTWRTEHVPSADAMRTMLSEQGIDPAMIFDRVVEERLNASRVEQAMELGHLDRDQVQALCKKSMVLTTKVGGNLGQLGGKQA